MMTSQSFIEETFHNDISLNNSNHKKLRSLQNYHNASPDIKPHHNIRFPIVVDKRKNYQLNKNEDHSSGNVQPTNYCYENQSIEDTQKAFSIDVPSSNTNLNRYIRNYDNEDYYYPSNKHQELKFDSNSQTTSDETSIIHNPRKALSSSASLSSSNKKDLLLHDPRKIISVETSLPRRKPLQPSPMSEKINTTHSSSSYHQIHKASMSAIVSPASSAYQQQLARKSAIMHKHYCYFALELLKFFVKHTRSNALQALRMLKYYKNTLHFKPMYERTRSKNLNAYYQKRADRTTRKANVSTTLGYVDDSHPFLKNYEEEEEEEQHRRRRQQQQQQRRQDRHELNLLPTLMNHHHYEQHFDDSSKHDIDNERYYHSYENEHSETQHDVLGSSYDSSLNPLDLQNHHYDDVHTKHYIKSTELKAHQHDDMMMPSLLHHHINNKNPITFDDMDYKANVSKRNNNAQDFKLEEEEEEEEIYNDGEEDQTLLKEVAIENCVSSLSVLIYQPLRDVWKLLKNFKGERRDVYSKQSVFYKRSYYQTLSKTLTLQHVRKLPSNNTIMKSYYNDPRYQHYNSFHDRHLLVQHFITLILKPIIKAFSLRYFTHWKLVNCSRQHYESWDKYNHMFQCSHASQRITSLLYHKYSELQRHGFTRLLLNCCFQKMARSIIPHVTHQIIQTEKNLEEQDILQRHQKFLELFDSICKKYCSRHSFQILKQYYENGYHIQTTTTTTSNEIQYWEPPVDSVSNKDIKYLRSKEDYINQDTTIDIRHHCDQILNFNKIIDNQRIPLFDSKTCLERSSIDNLEEEKQRTTHITSSSSCSTPSMNLDLEKFWSVTTQPVFDNVIHFAQQYLIMRQHYNENSRIEEEEEKRRSSSFQNRIHEIDMMDNEIKDDHDQQRDENNIILLNIEEKCYKKKEESCHQDLQNTTDSCLPQHDNILLTHEHHYNNNTLLNTLTHPMITKNDSNIITTTLNQTDIITLTHSDNNNKIYSDNKSTTTTQLYNNDIDCHSQNDMNDHYFTEHTYEKRQPPHGPKSGFEVLFQETVSEEFSPTIVLNKNDNNNNNMKLYDHDRQNDGRTYNHLSSTKGIQEWSDRLDTEIIRHLTEGGDRLIKYHRRNGQPSLRYLWIDFNDGSLHWSQKPLVKKSTESASDVMIVDNEKKNDHNTTTIMSADNASFVDNNSSLGSFSISKPTTSVTAAVRGLFERQQKQHTTEHSTRQPSSGRRSQSLTRFFRFNRSTEMPNNNNNNNNNITCRPSTGTLICNQTTPSSSSFISSFGGKQGDHHCLSLRSIRGILYTWSIDPGIGHALLLKHHALSRHHSEGGGSKIVSTTLPHDIPSIKSCYTCTFLLVLDREENNNKKKRNTKQRKSQPEKALTLQFTCIDTDQFYCWYLGLNRIIEFFKRPSLPLCHPLFALSNEEKYLQLKSILLQKIKRLLLLHKMN